MAIIEHRCTTSGHTCLSRRALLAAGGAAGALTLAACGADGGTTPTGTAPDGETGDTGAESTGGGGAIATLADIPVGGALAATTASGEAILLTQPTEGEVRAFSSVCTHQGCAVEAGQGELACPCHGSRFDLATGEPIQGPASDPLPEIPIEVADNGDITG